MWTTGQFTFDRLEQLQPCLTPRTTRGFQGEGVSAEASGLLRGDQTEAGREEYKVWNRLRRGWGSLPSEAAALCIAWSPSQASLPQFPQIQGVPHFS